MTRLGVKNGEPLVVDLRDRTIGTVSELWDALTGPCGLPDWFGRNLDAWNDALGTGAISTVLDAHPFLVIRVVGAGLFAPSNSQGAAFVEVTADTRKGRVVVE